ncbi:MAG: DUF192 domain-containing protein [Patescibacteria group bacterium]
MKKIKFIAILALSFMVVIAINALVKDKAGPYPRKTKVIVSGITIYAEIADTPKEREAGLSGHLALAENEGLVFVFETPTKPKFWMKDMSFPIDIIWINQSGKVIFITERAEPESYPLTFSPPDPVKYVLEVPAGFVEKKDVEIGDTMVIL